MWNPNAQQYLSQHQMPEMPYPQYMASPYELAGLNYQQYPGLMGQYQRVPANQLQYQQFYGQMQYFQSPYQQANPLFFQTQPSQQLNYHQMAFLPQQDASNNMLQVPVQQTQQQQQQMQQQLYNSPNGYDSSTAKNKLLEESTRVQGGQERGQFEQGPPKHVMLSREKIESATSPNYFLQQQQQRLQGRVYVEVEAKGSQEESEVLPVKKHKRKTREYVELEHTPEKNRFHNSKNILRTYQRAIFQYLQHHKRQCEQILGYPLNKIVKGRRQMMGNVQSIKEMRSLWIHDDKIPKKDRKRNKLLRVMSLRFLRQEAVSYFNHNSTRISDILSYRQQLIESLMDPVNFVALKQQEV